MKHLPQDNKKGGGKGDGDDDDSKAAEPKGGPDAGDYTPPKDLPIPGEGDAVDNSKQ